MHPEVIDSNNLSDEYPWPGLKSYNEEDHGYFFGRSAEIQDLLRLVRQNVLTVVFGPSGAGKSSLIKAGLFRALRDDGFEPNRIRLDHEEDLVEQAKPKLAVKGDTLWEIYHRLTADDRVKPVIIIDQFEEIFGRTYGRQESARFLDQLSDMVENYYPPNVRERIEKGETLDFDAARQSYRVVLVLREDYVWRLDELRLRMPSIMRARFVLKPFTKDQAREAIFKPGGKVFEAGAPSKIVDLIASKEGDQVVEPAILSLLCRELSNRRRPANPKITAGEIKGEDSKKILEKFWEDSIGSLDRISREPVRRYIEEHLVSGEGIRVAYPRENLAAHSSAVDKLIDGRLLRSEQRRGSLHLELTHDVLCPVILQSKNERIHQQQRRKLILVSAFAAMLFVFAIVSLWMWHRAEVARHEARSRELAAIAVEKLATDPDPQLGMLLAAEAVKVTTRAGDPTVLAAEDILRRAIFQQITRVTLRGDQGDLRAVAYSPDGHRLVTAGGDGTAKVWDQERGTVILTVRGDVFPIALVAFSPDGQEFATWSTGGVVRVWDSNSGQELNNITMFRARNVSSLAFTAKGYLAAANRDGWIGLWDLLDKRGLPKWSQRLTGTSPVLSNDGRWLALADVDGTVAVWNISERKMNRALKFCCIRYPLYEMKLSPDAMKLATVSADGTTTLWDLATGQMIRTIPAKGAAEAFSPDGKRFAVDDSLAVKVYDVATGRQLLSLRGHQGSITSMAFSPDGLRLATASDDRTTIVWEVRSREVASFHGAQSLIKSVGFSPDGRKLAIGAGSGMVEVWDGDLGLRLFARQGHNAPVIHAAFSSNGRLLATVSINGSVIFWNAETGNAETGRNFTILPLQRSGNVNAVISPDLQRLAFAFSNDKAVQVSNILDARKAVTIPGRHSPITSLAFSADGSTLATGSSDGDTRIWDAVSGKELRTLRGHQKAITGLALSPLLSSVATISDDGKAKLWDTATGAELRTLGGRFKSAAFAPDGRTLALATSDHSTELWDPTTGEQLLTLRGHEDAVTSIGFSADGRRLATAAEDGSVQIYTMDVNELLKIAANRVARKLSDQECQKYLRGPCPPE